MYYITIGIMALLALIHIAIIGGLIVTALGTLFERKCKGKG